MQKHQVLSPPQCATLRRLLGEVLVDRHGKVPATFIRAPSA